MNYYNLEMGTIISNNQYATEQIENKTAELVPAWKWALDAAAHTDL